VVFALVFVLLAFGLIMLLWGGALVLQGYLYQSPADDLPIRAAAGGTVLAAFLTFWCYLDANNGGKYDTLFEFSPQEMTEYDAFDTVMKKANGEETSIHYNKRVGSKGTTSDFFDDKGQPWKKNTNDSMAVAILIKEKDKPEPTRFNAKFDADGNFPRNLIDLRYTDEAGRYMSADALGRVVRKKTGVLFANLFINFFHFALWWAVLWYGMRFALWHACGLALVLWLFTMLVMQPSLFNQTRPKETRSAAIETRFVALAPGQLERISAKQIPRVRKGSP
jgi:hypothetical protein